MAPITMTRIDLRNRTLSAAQLRAALPRGGVDVDAVVPTVRPIVDAVAERGADAALEYGESFDGVRPATGPGAGRATGRRADRTGRRRPRRARGRDRTRPRRARRSAAHRHHDDSRAGCDRHRALGAGRARRPLRAGRQRRLSVQRGDERGARADRGRGLAGDRQPAAGRFRRPAAPDHPGRRRGCWASTRCGRSAVRSPSRCWPTAAPTPTVPSWRPST